MNKYDTYDPATAGESVKDADEQPLLPELPEGYYWKSEWVIADDYYGKARVFRIRILQDVLEQGRFLVRKKTYWVQEDKLFSDRKGTPDLSNAEAEVRAAAKELVRRLKYKLDTKKREDDLAAQLRAQEAALLAKTKGVSR